MKWDRDQRSKAKMGIVSQVRVVVTGAAGHLGSHLCRALMERGNQVVAIDNLITGQLDNLVELFGCDGFSFIKHDISEYTHVVGQVDGVMHLASPASPKDFGSPTKARLDAESRSRQRSKKTAKYFEERLPTV